MMNCDQAFETMTARDTELGHELEQHLSGCPRCREMAEVLSPVLVELHSVRQVLDSEAKFPSVREDWGVKLARRTAQDMTQRSARAPRRAASSTAWKSRIALASLLVLIGVTGGWGMMLLQSENSPSAPASILFASENCTWRNPERVDSRSPQTVTLTCIACHFPSDAGR
jgi:hypothetical protein